MTTEISNCLRLLTGTLVCVLAGCGGGGDSPGVAAITPAQTSILLRVVDSKQLTLVADRAVTIDFSGTGASKLVDSNGKAVSTIVTTTGLVTLSLANGVTPSAASPVEFSAVVRASRILPAARLTSVDSTANRTIEVNVISIDTDENGGLNNVQPGVTGTVAIGTSTNGNIKDSNGNALTSRVAGASFAGLAGLGTPTPSASVTIAPDVVVGHLVGAALQPAANGAITLVAVAQSPQATESLSSFPTGMTNVKLKDANGTVKTAATIRVDGYTNVVLSDAAGAAVDKFSKPISYSLEIPSTERDDSGKLPQVDTNVNVYRYDSVVGVWQVAAIGTVTALDTTRAMATVEFASDVPGIFAVIRQPAACGTTVKINRTAGDVRALNVTVLTLGFIAGDVNVTAGSFSTKSTPDAAGAVFVTLPGGLNVVGEAVIAKTGSCPRVIDVPIAAPRPAGRITVSTREACASGSNNRPVSTSVSLLRADNSVASSVQTDATGSAKFDYVEVGSYRLASINPRTGATSVNNISVVDGQTTDSPFLFALTCN